MGLWKNNIRKVEPYVPGEQPKGDHLIKLNTNENPYPPCPGVKKALENINSEDFRKYPDPACSILTEELAEYFHLENDQVFVVAGDSGIESWDDLAGKTIEVQADSSAEKALQDYPELTASFGALQTTPDYNTAFMDLEMGSIDAIAMDVTAAGYQIGQRDADFVILEEPLAAEEYGVGFKLDNEELRDDVQGALEEMQADGTLKAISEKWFGKDVTTIG